MIFDALFEAVHGHPPFLWQSRLAEEVAADGWPSQIDVPTGCGKTAVMDVAVSELVRQLIDGGPRTAPLRILFVVNRRVVVDDAHARALNLSARIASGSDSVLTQAREALQSIAGDGEPPLAVSRLRGGVPLETDWVRTPSQPAIVVSTVDQVGSRLLFRGYGTSAGMAPVHAGLLGCDARVFLDEAHLAEPFRQTIEALGGIEPSGCGPALTTLSATPGDRSGRRFELQGKERSESLIARRLSRPKRALLEESSARQDTDAFARTLADHAVRLGERARSVGVIVNRVATARRVHALLARDEPERCVLVIGRARSLDRDRIAERLAPLLMGAGTAEHAPRFVVATQCLEAGADLDLQALVTQAAPIDALRQRFGRCNRSGTLDAPEAVVVASKDDLAKKGVPIYGTRLLAAWELLQALAGDDEAVDFGSDAMESTLSTVEPEVLAGAGSERPDAPVLMPAYLDLWSRTSPFPDPSPDVPLFLHGATAPRPEVTFVWRAEAERYGRADDRTLIESLAHARPRGAETMSLPFHVARAWLDGLSVPVLADVPGDDGDTDEREGPVRRQAFRWRGPGRPGNGWIGSAKVRPGDVLVVPPSYGGCDEFGFDAGSCTRVSDRGHDAAWPYRGRSFSLRVSLAMMHAEASAGTRAVDGVVPEHLARCWRQAWAPIAAGAVPAGDDLAGAADKTLRAIVGDETTWQEGEESAFVRALRAMVADGGSEAAVIVARTTPFMVALRLTGLDPTGDGASVEARPVTDDDALGSSSAGPVTIQRHCDDVRLRVEHYAKRLQLDPDLQRDLALAAELHDIGKADLRFQQRLASDALGGLAALRGQALAKGAESVGKAWHETDTVLPRAWRHEALSVRMALRDERLRGARDPALVIYLVGTHHGHGRPWFPHDDLADDELRRLGRIGEHDLCIEPGPGPQRLGFRFPALGRPDDVEHEGLDWPQLFELVSRRHGRYGIARLEAILRLADHRVSGEYE